MIFFNMFYSVSVHTAFILTGIYTGEFFYVMGFALRNTCKLYMHLIGGFLIFKVSDFIYKVNDLRIYRLFIFLLYGLYVLL